MATLGLLLLWTGYTGLAYGFVFITGRSLTLSDLALPSHRGTYLQAWGAGAAPPAAAPPGSPKVPSPPPTPTPFSFPPGSKSAGGSTPPAGSSWKTYPGGF